MTRILVRAVMACFFISGVIGREAAATIYTIDETQSSLSFGMFIEGVPLSLPQFPGSDITSLSGTINANIAGSTITFTNTNNILFANQASPVAPGPGGGSASPGTTSILPENPGSNTANYGITFIFPNDPDDPLNLNTAAIGGYGNIQDLIASLNGNASFNGILFDAATLNVGVVSAFLDWNINAGNLDGPPQTGTPFLAGGDTVDTHFGLNTGAGFGSVLGDQLTIPISVNVPVQVDEFLIEVVFTGQIVAYVPEPATIIPAALGMLGFLAVAWRNRHVVSR